MYKKRVMQRIHDTIQLVLAQEMILAVDNFTFNNPYPKDKTTNEGLRSGKHRLLQVSLLVFTSCIKAELWHTFVSDRGTMSKKGNLKCMV